MVEKRGKVRRGDWVTAKGRGKGGKRKREGLGGWRLGF